MKFVMRGNRIDCLRDEKVTSGGKSYKCVVSFDAQLDAVAPHVAARLSRRETAELEGWMTERRRLQRGPAALALLESLPPLLESASAALAACPVLETGLAERLEEALRDLLEALEAARTGSDGEGGAARADLLKERLDIIKEEIA